MRIARLPGLPAARGIPGLPAVRGGWRALRAAWVLARIRRQSRTDDLGLCLDAAGRHLPWLTYPAIDQLAAMDFSDASIFEFGCGASTFWWSARAASVTAVELDAGWHRRIAPRLPPNAEVVLCSDGGRYPRVLAERGRSFDVVVIDGAERYRSAEVALGCLAPDGLVVLDNSDWYPNTARLLRGAGLRQVDFAGFGPLNAYPWATSLFFRPECRFLERDDADLVVPGGTRIAGGALDDGA